MACVKGQRSARMVAQDRCSLDLEMAPPPDGATSAPPIGGVCRLRNPHPTVELRASPTRQDASAGGQGSVEEGDLPRLDGCGPRQAVPAA